MRRSTQLVCLVLSLLAIGVSAQTVDDRLATAADALTRSDFPAAERAYRSLIEEFPGLGEAYEGLADALLGQSREGEAVATLLHAGQGLVQSAAIDEGVRFLQRAASLDPDNAAAHAALGYGLLQADRYRDARETLARALELGETDSRARLFLGAAQWESGDYDDAEATYRTLLAQGGSVADAARRSLGGLLVFRGRYEEAVPLLAAAVGREATSPRLRYDLARALEGSGRKSEAAELLAILVADAPDFLQGHFRLANLLQAAGDSARARRHLEVFSRLHEQHQRETRELGRQDARVAQGWFLIRERRFDEAARVFAGLPETAGTLAALATAHRAAGDRKSAVAAMRRAIELEPDRIDLRFELDQLMIEPDAP